MNISKWRGSLVGRLKANPFFAVMCLLECLVLLALGLSLFKKPVVLEVSPGSFLIWNRQNAQIATDGRELRIHDPAQAGTEAEYISEFYPLSAGAYVLTVGYESVTDMDNPSHSFGDSAGSLHVRSFANPAAVTGDPITLSDGKTAASTRVYVGLTGRIKDFQLVATYKGTGSLGIQRVILQEQVLWRWVRLMGYGLLFAAVNFLYCLLFAKGKEKLELAAHRYRHQLCLGAVVLLASLPLFANFLFAGHDLEFHLARIGALAGELEKGQFPVRMLGTMLQGYGYPTPLYYCDILLYIPALLYNGMLPLMSCYQIYVFLINAATCAAAWLCFVKITGSKTIGVVCAALYALSPHRLMTLYYRAAAGEYSAMAFLPLIVWGLWNVYHKPKGQRIALGEYLPLALGVTGILQCHVLSLEMTALFLLGIGLGLLRKTVQRQRLLALLKAAALSLGLGLWFLGPMVESLGSMSIWGNQPHVINKLQGIGLYPIQLLNLFHPASGRNAPGVLRGDMPLTLGLPLVLCLIPALYALLHRSRWRLEEDAHYPLLRISCWVSIAAIGLTTYLFPWDGVESWLGKTVGHYFGIVQFPWRYLTLAIMGLTALGAAAFQLLRTYRGALYRRAVALAAGAVLLSTGYFYSQFMFSANKITVRDYQSLPQGIYGSIGSGEYLLSDVDVAVMARAQVEVSSRELTVTGYQSQGQGMALACENSGAATQATLPLFAYDHYEAYDQATGEKLTVGEGGSRRLTVTVPAHYHGTIQVQYAPPLRWRVFEEVSLGAFLLVCFGLYRGRGRRLPACPS